MYVSLLYWLALMLPGYALVRRFGSDESDSGLLGVVGISYLAVLGLLSPVSILCYVFHAPIAVFSAACVVLVAAGAFEIARRGWWRDWGRLAAGAAGIELLIVVVDMAAGGVVGGFTHGDAVVHHARIRALLDHGFNNFDPFVGPPYFFPIYHTSLYHALYAACSQLTGVQYMSAWYASLPWAKLLVASGAYYMAWSVFGRRRPAWIAAIFTVGCQGPVTFLIYPNKLAPYWILPLMIGFTVQAFRTSVAWHPALKLAVGSLVLGQMHGLYAAFAGLILGPVLGVTAVWHLLKRRRRGWRFAACTAALSVALPFLLIAKHETKIGGESAAVAMPGAGHPAFRHFDDGRLAMHARFGWGIPENRRDLLLSGLVIACAALSLRGGRRGEFAVFLTIIATAAVLLFIPPLCTALLRVLGREWIVARMGVVFYLGFVVLVPAAIAYFIEPWSRRWWLRSAVSLVALAAAIPFSPTETPYRWPDYWANFKAPRKDRERYLEQGKKVRAFCNEHIPRGETVLTDEWSGMVLAANHDCYVVAPRRSSNGVTDLPQRKQDLQIMLALDTPWEQRRALLRKYHITLFRPGSPKDHLAWMKGHIKEIRRTEATGVIVLDTD